MITLTKKAADQLNLMKKEMAEEGQLIRFFVEDSDCCAGREYGMGFDHPQPKDNQVESNGANIIIDPASLEYLKDVEIDFDDGLHGRGFTFQNPNAKRTCGCGKSFN